LRELGGGGFPPGRAPNFSLWRLPCSGLFLRYGLAQPDVHAGDASFVRLDLDLRFPIPVEDQERPLIVVELRVGDLPSLGPEDAAIIAADGVEPVAGEVPRADGLETFPLPAAVLDAHRAGVAGQAGEVAPRRVFGWHADHGLRAS
jgi:hypothetical protein